MMIEYPFEIRDSDELVQRGVSYGYGDNNPRLIYRGNRHAVIREPGSTDWACLGQSAYKRAEWHLVEATFDITTMKITRIIRTEEPGRSWRRCRNRMINELRETER